VQQKKKPPPEDIEGFPLLHQALKVQCPLDEIKSIVKTYGFDDKKDKYGWSALHYACRFTADNLELIAWLLSNDVLNEADSLGRYPLHLACDSSPSAEVVSLLLHVSKCNGDNLVNQPTAMLKRLPLHIACNAGASSDVIEALLQADGIGAQKGFTVNRATNADTDLFLSGYDTNTDSNRRLSVMIADWKLAESDNEYVPFEEKENSSISQTTLVGKTALHLAICKRLPPKTIEILLRGDSTIVHQWYCGMLPLHVAIMNNYGEDIIKLLVDKDKEGTTLKQTLHFNETLAGEFPYSPLQSPLSITKHSTTSVSAHSPCAGKEEKKLLKSHNTEFSLDKQAETSRAHRSEFSHRSLTGYTNHLHGIRALHLCFLTRSIGAARLLLQREIQTKMKSEEKEKYASAIDRKTRRTALHMACEINCEVDIIKLLCEVDPKRNAIMARDINGSIPLHLACGHKDARYEVVKELLKEDQWGQSEILDGLKRSPLTIAVQANAPIDVLAILLEPKNVDVDSLDDKLVATLAGRIKKSCTLQTAIVRIMAQRIPFALLVLQLAVNLLAMVVFLIHTDLILRGAKGLWWWTDMVLFFCLGLFVLREVVQIASEKMNYIFDAQNIFEFTNILFLGLSLNVSHFDWVFEDEISNSSLTLAFDTKTLLTVAAIMLIINFIVSLRSAFLPFAR